MYEEARETADMIEDSEERSNIGQIRAKIRKIECSALAAKTVAAIHMAKVCMIPSIYSSN